MKNHCLKTRLGSATGILSVALLSVLTINLALADGPLNDPAPVAAAKIKTYQGTVAAVDAAEKTVTVKGTMFRKTFNASDACRVSLEDKPTASLSDLRPGHPVEIRYQDAGGVLAASQITQHNLVVEGYITSIDPAQRKLTIKRGGNKKELLATENCTVLLQGEKFGTLENLKIGHAVRIAYEPGPKPWTTRKIEQRAETFVGTIQAIDAGTRTVKARSFMAEKKFNLAEDCRIVVAGKTDARLRDLRIGDKVEFSYEDANGVLVANRIGLEAQASGSDGSQAAAK